MDNIANKIGLKLKALRGDSSLEDVSKIIGISKSLLSKYERGVTEPGSSALIKLARYYNVSLDWLLGFTDDPKPIIITSDLSQNSKNEILNFIEYTKQKDKDEK